jgi:hypothetical protein
MTAAIDVGLLAQLVWVSIAAGLVLSLCFSLAILGGARAGELRREGRDGAALAYGVIAVLALAAIAALVVFGISVIVAK